MDTTLILTYCLIDDMLQASGHREAPQRRVSDAEVMTTALCAARFFGGNSSPARLFLRRYGYIPRMLSKSQFNRRLHRSAPLFGKLFQGLASLFKDWEDKDEGIYLIDSFPVAVCDNIRIDSCRIYPKEPTDDVFRGCNASKRRYFYGLKVFLMTTQEGRPVEVFFTPGSYNDTAQLKKYNFDLAAHSTVYGDKAFNEYFTEDVLGEAAEITLLPLRKKNSTRSVAAYVEYIQHSYRKAVETAASRIGQMLPKSIHAVTARGFELKVFLFVLAFSIDSLL